MTITGLESDYYCVHNPIPVEISGVVGDTVTMQILDADANPLLGRMPIFYAFSGVSKIDISRWVRNFMAEFRETETYTSDPEIVDNSYVETFKVRFIDGAGNETVTRRFVHCALPEYSLSVMEDDCCLKVWKCYPFSAPTTGWDSRVLLIPNTDVEPDLTVCGCVDYDTTCCRGVYIKWLNAKGYYSYWLFPNFSNIEREAEEVFRTPRSVFDKDRTSNEETGGFDAIEKITVGDKIPEPYWDQLKTLVASPEVYMLSPLWEIGSDECAPDNWIRIIQDGPSFERNTKNNSADFEITFELPKVYTQKLI